MASLGVIRALFCGIFLLFLSSVSESVAQCPWACTCQSEIVDCSHRGLFQVPKQLPADAERIDLQGNNITIIFQSDFQHLKKLKILQLSENQIHTIERDAFSELNVLERLKLGNNRLGHIPDGIFSRLRHLQRLDLTRNELTALSRRALRGLSAVKSVHLDSNRLRCIDEKALEQLKMLDTLTLTNNNLTYVQLEPASVARLRTLRLSDNPIVCDCRVARLAAAVRAAGILGVAARCLAPASLKGALLSDLEPHEMICNGPVTAVPAECSAEPRCPVPCRCTGEGTVDCREKLLATVPAHIPHRANEIRLEQNEITEVTSSAFAMVKRVSRIDLSNNKIATIAPDAFSGLNHLTSLVLYGNKIKELPGGVFHGLSSLQLLLLNSNEVTCVRKDTFRDLQNLKLLSLYDNNIRSIPNGTFDPLSGIQTLHLGRNPFVCECPLRWLASYLRLNPIETSGAKCESPKRLARKRIDALRDDSFKCKPGAESSDSCGEVAWCPAECACAAPGGGGGGGATVRCVRAKLNDFPKLPPNTETLIMPDNNLGQIRSDGLFGRLPDLVKLDLRNNGITVIEDNAFDGAANIQELLLDGNLLQTVGDKMFLGLHSLATLSLTSNKITCVTPGAFDHLSMLTALSIDSNPLHCSCHVSWLGGWLRARSLSRAAACATPSALSNRKLWDIDVQDYKCSAEDRGCLPPEYCPSPCSCEGTVVRCSRAKLKALPDHIPKYTTELYLDSNEITSISASQLRQLTSLVRLDLSNNALTVLPNDTLAELPRLSTLILSYNKLRCVQRDALRGLTQLRVLSLHGNNISILHDGVFRDLHSISHVALGSNPLYCDCDLRWLGRWAREAGEYVEAGIARCAYPARNAGKILLNTPPSAFICTEPPPADVVSKCDACYTQPCENGGRCTPTGAGFECACARGYHGTTCTEQIDACYGDPCAHGDCRVLEEGRFQCACHPGYTGLRCEYDIDDCESHRCQNNGTCVDHLQGYSCRCQTGFMGEFCETKIPFCTGEWDPCRNGGVCTDHFSHYTCTCPKGYSGENCTINADDCINNMCQNGASCVDGLDEYRCACASGYAGRYCEAAPLAALGTSPCAHHDCLHGVCYLPDQEALQDDIMLERPLLGGPTDYLCKCAPGYSGRFCEYLTSLSFTHNDSLVELEPLRTKPDANVTLVFSTSQQHGVLLYYGESEHLAVELFNGRVRVSYDVGNHPVSTMYSFEMVSDGGYHKVELLAIKKNFTLRVDNGPARSIINEGAHEYLRVERPLFLGGVPEDVAKEAFSKWHLRNVTSFKGCVKEAWINHKRVDFVNAVRSSRTRAGCGEEEPLPTAGSRPPQDDHYRPDPCVPNPCAGGGRCVRAADTSTDYTCRCRPGYAGAQCELRASLGGAPVISHAQPVKIPPRRAPSRSDIQASPAAPAHKQEPEPAQTAGCRKEATREYITEGSCRSRRVVRAARCAGTRGACARAHCCSPKKTKKRKIRLVCADGSRYTKDVEIIRKCGCGRKCARTSPFLH